MMTVFLQNFTMPHLVQTKIEAYITFRPEDICTNLDHGQCKVAVLRLKNTAGSIFEVLNVRVTPLYAFIVLRQTDITSPIVDHTRLQCIKARA